MFFALATTDKRKSETVYTLSFLPLEILGAANKCTLQFTQVLSIN